MLLARDHELHHRIALVLLVLTNEMEELNIRIEEFLECIGVLVEVLEEYGDVVAELEAFARERSNIAVVLLVVVFDDMCLTLGCVHWQKRIVFLSDGPHCVYFSKLVCFAKCVGSCMV